MFQPETVIRGTFLGESLVLNVMFQPETVIRGTSFKVSNQAFILLCLHLRPLGRRLVLIPT